MSFDIVGSRAAAYANALIFFSQHMYTGGQLIGDLFGDAKKIGFRRVGKTRRIQVFSSPKMFSLNSIRGEWLGDAAPSVIRIAIIDSVNCFIIARFISMFSKICLFDHVFQCILGSIFRTLQSSFSRFITMIELTIDDMISAYFMSFRILRFT